jgi:hypothetical protein
MQRCSVEAAGHAFRLSYSLWNGDEAVECDGAAVSKKRILGLRGHHAFSVREDGQQVDYSVKIGGFLGHVIRRNGAIVAEGNRPVLRFLTAFGLIALLDRFLRAVSGFFWPGIVEKYDRLVGEWDLIPGLALVLLLSWWLKRRLRSDT